MVISAVCNRGCIIQRYAIEKQHFSLGVYGDGYSPVGFGAGHYGVQ